MEHLPFPASHYYHRSFNGFVYEIKSVEWRNIDPTTFSGASKFQPGATVFWKTISNSIQNRARGFFYYYVFTISKENILNVEISFQRTSAPGWITDASEKWRGLIGTTTWLHGAVYHYIHHYATALQHQHSKLKRSEKENEEKPNINIVVMVTLQKSFAALWGAHPFHFHTSVS